MKGAIKIITPFGEEEACQSGKNKKTRKESPLTQKRKECPSTKKGVDSVKESTTGKGLED